MDSSKNKGRKFVDLLKEHNVDDVLEGEIIDEIDLMKIIPNPYQPRKFFDEEKINELTLSIKEHGVFQPIILKNTKDGFLIVSGERRFRAAKNAGLKTIPSIVRPYEEPKIAEIALAENLQREDLNPIEEAEAYKMIMEKLNITQEALAKKVGKSRSHVTNILGLLSLDDAIKQMVWESKISMGHARAISKMQDSKAAIKMAQKVIHQNLSVRQVEFILSQEPKKRSQSKEVKDKRIVEIENNLSIKFNAKVSITKNRVSIYSEENIENIIDRLNKL